MQFEVWESEVIGYKVYRRNKSNINNFSITVSSGAVKSSHVAGDHPGPDNTGSGDNSVPEEELWETGEIGCACCASLHLGSGQ